MNPEKMSPEDVNFKAPTTGQELWKKTKGWEDLEPTGRMVGNLRELGTPEQIEKIRQDHKDSKEREATRRAKELEIPSEVKKGTVGMVWYELRNSGIVCKEAMDKENDLKKISKLQERILEIKEQQNLLDSLSSDNRSSDASALDAEAEIEDIINKMESRDDYDPRLDDEIIKAGRGLQELLMREASKSQDN